MPREERVKQVIQGTDPSLHDYASYVPVGNAVKKIKAWQEQGAEICYLSSHTSIEAVNKDRLVLQTYGFPEGMVFSRAIGQSYQDIAETVLPDVLIEDDCESIGGEEEMTITHVRPEYKKRITSIIFLIACCTSSHRRHSMRVTPHACPVHRFQCQITPLFFGHCGWLTNAGR